MSEADAEIVIRRVRPDEATAYRAFRLRALADAPDAFGQSLAEAEAMPWSLWLERTARSAAGIDNLLLVAATAATDEWHGMTVCFFDDDRPDLVHVVAVWVAPEARRRGLARTLLDGVLDWARTRGAQEAQLWVNETNQGAVSLYLAAGFTPTGVVEPFREGSSVNVRELTLKL
jgi:ribosomal protein S18 acetylase RimI-like enzyme